ncbi:hypothetical protein [Bradyrhizobium sp. AZCC 2289]|uniref:hypothetical protein n=1 Tax=Bradyrhizobium sp. AZCC 2289 TaxID=3117026 RepID=UPI002FF1741F
MNAADALKQAIAIGVRIAIDEEENLMLEAAVRPPSEVIALLSRHKPEIVNLLKSVTASYADVFARLESRCPDHVDEERWRQCIDDGRHFLVSWGDQAEALGWTAKDLFGLHQPPGEPHPSYQRLSRDDKTGLLWLLRGRLVVALTETTAAIRTTGNSAIIYRKCHKPALGPLGDSLEDFA